jgi:hypothetical protein
MAQISKINLGGIDYDVRDKVLEKEVANIKPIVNQGTINNAADEEDLTSENSLLKLKDRAAVSGKGYVILRKNKSFAEQVTQPNTIYEIRYDFDLGRANITLPEGSVLKFDGGSLLNGGVDCNNCSIIADEYACIFQGVNITNALSLSVCWLGAKNVAEYDSSDAFEQAMRGAAKAFVPANTYYLHRVITMPENSSLVGSDNNSAILHLTGIDANYCSTISDLKLVVRDEQAPYIIRISNKVFSAANVKIFIKNIRMQGTSSKENATTAFLFECSSDGLNDGFHSIYISDVITDGYLNKGIDFVFERNHSKNIWLSDISVSDVFFYAAKYCIDQTIKGSQSNISSFTECRMEAIYFDGVRTQYNKDYTEKFIDIKSIVHSVIEKCFCWDAPGNEGDYNFTSYGCQSISIRDYPFAITLDFINLSDVDNDDIAGALLGNAITFVPERGVMFGKNAIAGKLNNFKYNPTAYLSPYCEVVEMTSVKVADSDTRVHGVAYIYYNSFSMASKTSAYIFFVSTTGVPYVGNYVESDSEVVLYPIMNNLSPNRTAFEKLPSAWGRVGQNYYLTDKRVPCWSNANGDWVDGAGNAVRALRFGTTNDRPTRLGIAITNGYAFYDTTIQKVIFYFDGKWIDANGATV